MGFSRSARASWSSLCLQGMSMESSLSSQTLCSQSSIDRLEFSSCPASAVLTMPLGETGGKSLVQSILLFVLTLQIPTIAALLPQNLRNALVLVFLGSAPFIFFKIKIRFTRSTDDSLNSFVDLSSKPSLAESSTSRLSIGAHPTTPSASLKEIESYYERQESDETVDKSLAASPSESDLQEDQWGHFAEIDENRIRDQDVPFFLRPAASPLSKRTVSTAKLGPLNEIFEDRSVEE